MNFKSALNAVAWLASENKNIIKSGKPEREYLQLVQKYENAQPMIGRLKDINIHEDKYVRMIVIFLHICI